VLAAAAALVAGCGSSSESSSTSPRASRSGSLASTTTSSHRAVIPAQVKALPTAIRVRAINLIGAGWRYDSPEATSDLQGICSQTGVVIPGAWGMSNAKAHEAVLLFMLGSSGPAGSSFLRAIKVDSSDEAQQGPGPVVYLASNDSTPNINAPSAGPPKPTIPVSSVIVTAEKGAPGLQPSNSKAPCAKYVAPR
jgi:hypothetical protein